MERVIIYCRKSAKPKNTQERLEEKQILSLESQEKELKDYAIKCGFKVIKLFKENESAYKIGRPMFNEMIRMIEAGKADSILVWHTTRIARNSSDGGSVIYLFDEGHLKNIITPNKRYQNTGDDKFFLSLEFAMAKKSSDDTASFVKRDIQAKANRGEFPGKAPLGYLNIDKEGRIAGKEFNSHKQMQLENQGRPLKRIEIDPLEGDLVKKVFIEAAKGLYPLNALCEYAYEIGLRANRSGKKLVKASLKRMLENPFYYGVFLWEGQLYSNGIKHEGLVSKELFDIVQEMISQKSFKKKKKTEYLFSGLIKCGDCGSTISSQIQKGIRYYHCPHYQAKKTGTKCYQKKYFPEKELDKKIHNLLKTVQIPQEFIEWAKDVIRENYDEENQTMEKARLTHQNNLNLAKKKLNNLFQLKISPQNENGVLLSDEEYLFSKRLMQEEISTIEEKLNDNNQSETSWVERCESFYDFASRLQETFQQGNAETKQIIIKNIGKIVLNQGKLAFELKEPYMYAAEIVKVSNEYLNISEPIKVHELNDNPKYAPLIETWRNGRDSNPRPPA